jgi:cytochrome c
MELHQFIKVNDMKNNILRFGFTWVFLGSLLIMFSCGGGTKESAEEAPPPKSMVDKEVSDDPMLNKGIGPITNVVLEEEINTQLAAEGAEIYNQMCTACHKPTEKYIGPAQKGVLDRRSPEWVMNMILNPVEMVEKDPIAKKLLIEFNGAPMANQNLTKEQARAVVEYFRTL